MEIEESSFGTLPDGEPATLFTLRNKHGLTARITNYGGILVSLELPDREGDFADVVLGKDNLEGYLAGHPFFGALVGRVAGRISNASFTLGGTTCQLPANQPPNCLHGGPGRFHQVCWEPEIFEDYGVPKLRLTLTDPDGHNGFPGNVETTVTYALLDDNTLELTYHATTDQTTPFNPTNHSYFNLRGAGNGDVLGHEVQLFADSFAPVDENSSLLGRSEPVRPDYNDYREPVVLGDLPVLETGNADNHFFLRDGRTPHPKQAARVREPDSGRTLEVFTTEPGVQFYAGLNLGAKAPEPGKAGAEYARFGGLCLETQDYPDSVNFPEMGDALLDPGEPFHSTTLFRFQTDGE